jgi:hypothetical protein
VAYNFQTGNNRIKQHTECESIFQKLLFGSAVLITLMSGRKYVMPQYGDCSGESSVVTLVFETKSDIKMQHLYRTQYGEDPLSDNAI